MSIDTAAAAFDADMGNSPSSTVDTSTTKTMPIEDLFPARALEDDVQAGGDDLPLKGVEEVEPAKVDKAAKDAVEGEIDEPEDLEDLAYKEPPKEGDEQEEEDPKPKEDGEEEDDEDIVRADPKAIVEVTIDGKPAKVTVEEAASGYIRVQTFHQRLNEVNQAKDVLRQEAGVLLEDKTKTIKLLDEVQETYKALLPKEPDWDALYAQDANKARKLQKDYEQFNTTLAGLAEKRNTLAREAQNLAEQEIVRFAKSERQKFEDSNPHWKSDPKKRDIDTASMVRTARAVGFKDSEIAETLDSRMLTILLKASKYDRIIAARPKALPRGKTPVNPGAGRVRTAPKGIERSQKQLARSGKVDDAAAVFEQIIRQ